jgi:phosphoribosylformimino-5-aminoimidazole carboxamide ribotide isomerase
MVDALGGDHVAFSVDLRDGRPMGTIARDVAPERIAAQAARAGVCALVVVDLARVGAGTGLDVDMLARVRDAAPAVRLAAGGGVRGPADLERIAAAGCDAALVATALHDGRLTRAAVIAARAHAAGAQRSVSR